MTQINFSLIWDYIKSFIFPIVVVILLISQFNSCGNEKKVAEIATKFEILENEHSILKADNIVLKTERDKNKKLLSESDERIIIKDREIAILKAEIFENNANAEKQKKAVKDYDNEAFAKYYNDRYKTNKAKAKLESVELKTGLPLLITNDLINGDVAKANFKLQTESYSKLYENYNELTGQITILKDENIKLVNANENANALLDKSAKLNEDSVKQLKKMKFKAKVSQYLVPVGIAAGFVAGIIIAK